MILHKKAKHYISPIDKFFNEFDLIHPASRAQQDEKNKYKRIYKLRDNIQNQPDTEKIWEEF